MRDPEHERLRQRAIRHLAYGDDWGHEREHAAFDLGGGPLDDAWTPIPETDATDLRWFYFRNADDGDCNHCDRALTNTESGKIEGTAGCGMSYYDACQPCRFAEDVQALLDREDG